MRRTNLGNKTVIKAITIGLSAVMATAQPMVVLAEEAPTTTPDPQPSAEMLAVSAEAGKVADDMADVEDAVNDTLKEDLVSVNEAVADLVEVGLTEKQTDEDGKEIPVYETDADGNLVTVEDGNPIVVKTNDVLKEEAADLTSKTATVNTDITLIGAEVTKLNAAAGAEIKASGEFDSKETELMGDIDDVVDDYGKTVDNAVKAVNDANTQMNNATYEEGQTILNNAVAVASAAKGAYKDALDELDVIEGQYEDAKTAYEEKLNALNDLIKTIAGERYQLTDQEIDSMIKSAKADVDLAKAAAEVLESKAAAAKQEVEALQAEFEANGYQAILDAQDELADLTEADAITAKQEEIARLSIKAFINSIGGTFGEFTTTEPVSYITGYEKNKDGSFKIVNGAGVPVYSAPVTYNKLTYTDANGEPVELLFRINEDGSIVALTSEVVNDGEAIVLKAKEEAVAAINGYYVGKDTNTAELYDLYTEDQILTKEGSTSKYVADKSKLIKVEKDEKAPYGYTPVAGSKKISYAWSSKKEYIRETVTEDYVIVKSTPITETGKDHNDSWKKSKAKDQLEKMVNKALGKYGFDSFVYVEGQQQYTFTDDETGTTVTVIAKLTGDSDPCKINKGWGYTFTFSGINKETETKKITTVKKYGVAKFEKVCIPGKPEVPAVYGQLETINEVVGQSLKEEDLDSKIDELKDIWKAYGSYDELIKAAHRTAKELDDEHGCDYVRDQFVIADGEAMLLNINVLREDLTTDYRGLKQQIEGLQKVIWELKKAGKDYTDFENKLVQVKLDLGELKAKIDDLDDIIDELEDKLEDKIPDEDDYVPSDDDTDDDDDDDAVLPPSGTPGPGTPVFTPAYPGGTVTGGAGVAATNIADGATPLAGSVQTNNKSADDVINVTDTKDIKDSKTPLANIPADQQEAAANFWWLVLAAVAAATGVGSYKYYQNNKKAEVAEAKKED